MSRCMFFDCLNSRVIWMSWLCNMRNICNSVFLCVFRLDHVIILQSVVLYFGCDVPFSSSLYTFLFYETLMSPFFFRPKFGVWEGCLCVCVFGLIWVFLTEFNQLQIHVSFVNMLLCSRDKKQPYLAYILRGIAVEFHRALIVEFDQAQVPHSPQKKKKKHLTLVDVQ